MKKPRVAWRSGAGLRTIRLVTRVARLAGDDDVYDCHLRGYDRRLRVGLGHRDCALRRCCEDLDFGFARRVDGCWNVRRRFL